MALILKDRVKETSSSSGTGNITLGGAFPGYQTFNAAIASGSTVYYTIHNLAAGFDTEWEVGLGTFTSPTTLVRTTVLSSSNSGSATNFTAGVNGLEVFITQPAEEAVYLNNATGKVEVGGNGTNTVTFTNINTTNLTANTVTLTAGTITTNAASATDIVNKQYVDGIVAAGVHYHEPVLVESPTALVAVYNQPNGAGNGVGATLTNSGANVALVIDGVSLSNTARVLVYTQSNAVQNGVYTVTNPGAPDSPGPGVQWVLTRATDADTYVVASSAGLSEGSTFFVQSGNTGAGEVYTCNTPGTITFGTTNITFVQVGSAQIYSAGTGLSLTNTTFSISNTAVTAATYGDAGTVATFTVNAQGQLTNAANAAINASSITLGTLANARTTADSANGASTIVARDANGDFTANTITATTSNATTFNGTTGSFTSVSGNGVALTAINASNVTSGTLDNARTTGNTANSASTIVLRDANGSFGANIITATFSGDGSAINAINASNISSGTIDNSRTTAASANGASTIVLRDAGGNFSANMITADITGNGAALTAINASNITSGTINNARTTASSANGASTIVLRDANGSFDANVVNATNLSGGGTSITSMNASNLSAGTVDSARVSGSYTGITGVGTLTAGTWQGNVIATTYGGTNLSSFTANGVVYASSTTALATGSGFVFDGTNVGINNTSPAVLASTTQVAIKANVNADSMFVAQNSNGLTTAKFGFQFTGGVDNPVIGSFTNHPFLFLTNNTERMRIDSSGNVGIGTSSPVGKFDVGGASTAALNTTAYIHGTDNASYGQSLAFRRNGSNSFVIGDSGAILGSGGGATILYTYGANHQAYYTNGSERMRIDSSGNVGINTTSAGVKLGVVDTSAGAATFPAIFGNRGTTVGTQVNFGLQTYDAGSAGITNVIGSVTTSASSGAGSADMVFQTTASGTRAERMRITSAGGLAVGTTSNPGVGAIYATGNITAFFSDKRLKTVSGKIENALDKVNSLSGVYYTMNDVAKSHGYDSDETHVGVLAQEVEAVLPEIVKPAPFDLDENNNSKSGENYKTVQYEKLVPLLIEAIKELKAEVDALKGK